MTGMLGSGHWNGKKWTAWLGGALGVSPNDIIGFANNDIWLAGRRIGDNPIIKSIRHWNGNDWTIIEHTIEMDIRSLWGTSSDNIFFGFNNGEIAYYNGSNFQITDTKTRSQIIDLHGLQNDEIYAIGSALGNEQPRDSTHHYIFKYSNNKWQQLNYFLETTNNTILPFPNQGFWSTGDYIFGTTGNRIYYLSYQNKWETIFEPSTKGVWKIGGLSITDIFTTGYLGSSIYHFNGKRWTNVRELENLNFYGRSIYMLKDHVFICGYANNKAYVIRGRRWSH